MASVRQSGTTPELSLRAGLHRLGLRYRVNAKALPGSPDLIFPKYKVAIFVHGCFWHGHSCRAGRPPGTNEAYWIPKMAANRRRDAAKEAQLAELGWHVIVVWECTLRRTDLIPRTVAEVAKAIRHQR
jgi:DNA mismatch endonuclease (patch repair protein)